MVKALKLQELLEPHREVYIPHGAYVSTIICTRKLGYFYDLFCSTGELRDFAVPASSSTNTESQAHMSSTQEIG